MTTTMTSLFDIGCGVKIRYMLNGAGQVIGIKEMHQVLRKRRICGTASILFDLPEVHEQFPGRPVWKVNSAPNEPLTLWPSILCNACRRHGFIFEGRWLPG